MKINIIIIVSLLFISCHNNSRSSHSAFYKAGCENLTKDDFYYIFNNFLNQEKCLAIYDNRVPIRWNYDENWLKFGTDTSKCKVILNKNHAEIKNYYFIVYNNKPISYFEAIYSDSIYIEFNQNCKIVITQINNSNLSFNIKNPESINDIKCIFYIDNPKTDKYMSFYGYSRLYMPGDSIYYETKSRVDDNCNFNIKIDKINIASKSIEQKDFSFPLDRPSKNLEPILIVDEYELKSLEN